jgi:hypothetical protein
LGDDLAAMDARPRADVEHMIGAADGFLVMLHHDDGVAEVAQPAQRLEQPGIVALVQPDRGLIEHVQHTGQSRADLRSEPDSLAFAARERARGAREREVLESDVDEKLEPLADFLEHPRGDLVVLAAQLLGQLGEPLTRALDRQLRDFADMPPADLHAQRLRL